VRLAECRARTEPRLIRLKRSTELVSPTIERAWERGLAAPVATVRRWLHGDLHSQNVLVLRGKISAIIDWGDISGGDAATDLVVAWSLFETRADRERLLEQYRPEQALLERGIAWTVFFGAVLLESGLVNSPRLAEDLR
jgi:aminoglycoside phosphotransferase (APT) family kinase protein